MRRVPVSEYIAHATLCVSGLLIRNRLGGAREEEEGPVDQHGEQGG